ncbi:hemolysin family protein [Candidatus Aquiluna sp. UB-MaderosW2red]|uniref:hemolysin family protein n=1 Tax=Candidatus Aquiluna sp. UB-MaderosW2red TaxID=1855377 RepID=UPI000875DDF9|nr:hemolysin family protein [Candidatus Aquiluna sp. UB-MaderosW2red]SCX09074.1 Hemolysin, contains CBS domains [Candidatus Aquiluna sp. UB-MaderosW2red]
MSDYLLLAVGLALIFGTGLFVASEFSLINLERIELESRREGGEKGLDRPIAALIKTSTHLSAAQLGITLTTLLTGFVAEPSLSRLLSPWLGTFGLDEGAISAIALVLAMTIATIFSFLIGELVPKNMALSEPLKVLKLVVRFQTGFTWIFGPIVKVLNDNGNWLVRKFGVEPREELSSARTAEELASLVRRSAYLGSLEKDTAQLLEKTISMSTLVASDIMTPRPKMYSLERDQSAQDLVLLAKATGHSRFPVTGEDSDDIVGVVHLKRAVSVPYARRDQVPVSALMIDPIRVPETMSLDRLILQLRGRGLQFGIVVDEYGGTAGIATLEDAVEELVGELADEHDRSRSGISRYENGSMTFSGLTRPLELAEFGVMVAEDDDYDTIAGFLMAELGEIPEVGNQVEIAAGVLSVLRMDGRRVDRVKFTPANSNLEVNDE